METIAYTVLSRGCIGVYIGRYRAGSIQTCGNGFQYVTKSGSEGEVFATVAEVKNSLESQ